MNRLKYCPTARKVPDYDDVRIWAVKKSCCQRKKGMKVCAVGPDPDFYAFDRKEALETTVITITA